jgi:molybdopterin/thiamine biosynthesis adenylyltransferase
MPSMNEVHSRSILAGYDPGLLGNARVLVVGVGALGQNVLQNLALVGVGRLLVIDFDKFVTHNATRSPLYPAPVTARELGLGKALVVAHGAARISTVKNAEINYADSLIQVLGDGAINWADVVVASVDSINARAWLAERCRLLAKPMVEGGFSGTKFNISSFSAADGTACFRCGHPDKDSSISCTRYALQAEADGIVPAIQTAAAVVGGYQAEQVLQVLHGNLDHLGRCSYGNVSKLTWRTAVLPVNPNCPNRGGHDTQEVIGNLPDAAPTDVMADLIARITSRFGRTMIRLPEYAIITDNCTSCRAMCMVQATEAAWLVRATCNNCGGPWPTGDAVSPEGVQVIHTEKEMSEALSATPLVDLGIRSGASIEALVEDGRKGLLRLGGDIIAHTNRATIDDAAAGAEQQVHSPGSAAG